MERRRDGETERFGNWEAATKENRVRYCDNFRVIRFRLKKQKPSEPDKRLTANHLLQIKKFI